MKFKTQHVYTLHENSFIYNSFGPNEKFCHNNFKAIIAYQNKLIKHPPKIIQIGRCSLFLCGQNLYLHPFGYLESTFPWMKCPCISKVIMWKNKADVQSIRWWITDRCSFSGIIHISNIYLQ